MSSHADSIVFGAAGFIGRSLVAELLQDGQAVVAAVRETGRKRLADWLVSQGVDQSGLTIVTSDIAQPNLGLDEQFDGIRDVYNTAALMKFGLDVDQARRVNVTAALEVARWAHEQPALRRLVHISGYRAVIPDGPESDYRNGSYGASKMEADVALRRLAAELDIALTIANPSTVIGPGQYFGLSDLVYNLWQGKLPALPGNRDTFVPVVGIDYVAKFLARLPRLPETANQSYTILDPDTPSLPDLTRMIADHLGVRAPKFSIPAPIIRALPRKLTNADPESLVFITDDRYDTSATDAVAASMGLAHEPVGDLVRRWADGIVATDNGTAPHQPGAGLRDGVWSTGDHEVPEYVLLHGIPVDSAAWADVRTALDSPSLAADLPGLGRSAPRPDSGADWLRTLMAPVRSRPVLVGHSLGTEAAIEYALRHPDRISRLVLISPAFLQQRAPWALRSPITPAVLERMPAAKLAQQMGVPNGPAVASAVANLRRPGVARRTVAALSAASDPKHRATMAERLNQVLVPVDIIAGSDDPLVGSTTHPVATIDGAGHYPQISHPKLVADIVAGRHVSSSRPQVEA